MFIIRFYLNITYNGKDNNKLFTAQVNDDNIREFKEFDISSGINNKVLQETADVTSFDEGMDVITVNPSGDKFIGVDKRGRDVVNLETTNNFSVNSFNLLDSFKVDRLVRGDVFESIPRDIDPTFLTPSINGFIRVCIDADDGIVIGGEFTTVDGVSRPKLAKLNYDGQLINEFNPNVTKTVIGGSRVSGNKMIISEGHYDSSAQLKKYNFDGSLDSSFNVNNFTNGISGANYVYDIAEDNVCYYLTGNFRSVNGVSKPYFCRVNKTTGSLDTSYGINFNQVPWQVVTLSNGNVILGGQFTSPRRYLIVLNPDGSIKTDVTIPSLNNRISGLTVVTINGEEKVYVSSESTTPHPYLIRLNDDGTLDETFVPPNFNSNTNRVVRLNGVNYISGNFTIPSRYFTSFTDNGEILDTNDYGFNVSTNRPSVVNNQLYNYGDYSQPRNRIFKFTDHEFSYVTQTEIPFVTLSTNATRLVQVTTSVPTPASDFNTIIISDGTNEVTILPSQVNTEVNIDTLIGRNLSVTYDLTGNKDINTILSEYNLTINK